MSDRTQSVYIHDASSPVRPLAYGVPQGSVLAPQLFSIYTAPFAKIISRHNLMFHLYADDTHICLPVKPLQMDVSAAVERIQGCVAEIRAMESHIVKVNLTIIIIQRITHAFDCAYGCAFDKSNVCGSHSNTNANV